MAEGTALATDKGVGLTLILCALALMGALVMATTAPEQLAAYGFAAAVAFASLAIVGVHLYWDG